MQSPQSPGALAGLRVIDASQQPGPAQVNAWLAGQGAWVLGIAPPPDSESDGQPSSESANPQAQAPAQPPARRLHLDLHQQSGRDMLLHLLADADVLIENFEPGTLERWGLGHTLLLRRFPHLLHCRLGGSAGPAHQQALLQTLRAHRRGGGGGFVDIGLQSAGIPSLRGRRASVVALAQADAAPPPQAGIHGLAMLATATEPVLLALGDNRQFALLCQHLGVPAWPHDPRFASASARARHGAELQKLLEQCLATHDGAMLADALAALGVHCAPVLGVPECLPAHWPAYLPAYLLAHLPTNGADPATASARQRRLLAAHRLPALIDAEHYLPSDDAADAAVGGATHAG